jgi:hypothetical protein
MAKQKFRPTRLGGFSGTKAYIQYVEILKKRRNAVGRTFYDAINPSPVPGRGNAGSEVKSSHRAAFLLRCFPLQYEKVQGYA